MTIQACYQQMGGDYAQVQQRLPSARLIEKFVAKFLEDGSFAELRQAMQTGQRKTAFRAAHAQGRMCKPELHEAARLRVPAHRAAPTGSGHHPRGSRRADGNRRAGLRADRQHHPRLSRFCPLIFPQNTTPRAFPTGRETRLMRFMPTSRVVLYLPRRARRDDADALLKEVSRMTHA